MSSRNVAVRKDVYEALQKEKRGSESFTELFVRLLHQRGPLEEILGTWPEHAAAADTRAWERMRGSSPVRRSR